MKITNCLKVVAFSMAFTASSAYAGIISFVITADQTFTVPSTVTTLNILAIGGGGGGANGHQGGGGAGYIASGNFLVNPGDMYAVVVGTGGSGAQTDPNGNSIIGLTAGTASSFGGLLVANGGGVVSGINRGGHNGSSGGGAACNAGSQGGAGGSLGSNGQSCVSGNSMPIGFGTGDYSATLARFLDNILSAGAGGAGGTGTHAGGGGAGGILVNGTGPNAGDGAQSWSGKGGAGYGAGGGAGGYNGQVSGARVAGGNGANGLVYVEYSVADIPEPQALALLGLCLIGLVFSRKKLTK
ncbi:PEP-CTERM sorting domain-containing protein [Glaciecola sp. MF2-115]|uniref:PEP-CTERM sorting domain-containing protein n=1 Tax=Glaciecola sp. MF2-115 TaxID=3384827 RepID=UPI00399F62D7